MPMGAFIYILYRERHILLYVVFIHLSNLLPCLDIYTYAHIYIYIYIYATGCIYIYSI